MLRFTQLHPEWYDLNLSESCVLDLIKRGVIYQLKDRDALGRKIIVAHVYKLNTDTDSCDVYYRALSSAIHSLSTDEITQITGIILINDFKNLNLNMMKIFPLSVCISMMEALTCAMPFRCKKIYSINMPSFFKTVADTLMKSLKPKIKDRIKFFSTTEEFLEEMDGKLLPEEIGGRVSSEETIQNYLEFLKANEDFKFLFHGCKINSGSLENDENIGSFRKLEID